MLDEFWKLGIISSVGCILVVLGVIVTMPNILQIITLVAGLVVCFYGIFALTKYLLKDQKK